MLLRRGEFDTGYARFSKIGYIEVPPSGKLSHLAREGIKRPFQLHPLRGFGFDIHFGFYPISRNNLKGVVQVGSKEGVFVFFKGVKGEEKSDTKKKGKEKFEKVFHIVSYLLALKTETIPQDLFCPQPQEKTEEVIRWFVVNLVLWKVTLMSKRPRSS